jgi:3-hydroxy-D-aspartate aldolase
MRRNDLPTPALLLDLDLFEANLRLMAAATRQRSLRPHAKAHKCAAIAKRQIAAGAIGVCVATAAEAELMSRAGVPGVLLTSPVADPIKMRRIARSGAMVVIDHPRQAGWYDEAARAVGRVVEALIDIDAGDHRTGAQPGEQALAVARAVDRAANLRLKGIQVYSVRGSHAAGRAEVAREVFAIAASVRDAMIRDGLPCEILSGGSTGSADVDPLGEIQAGSYIFMDMAYAKLGLPYHHALTVLTTVVSANHRGFVTVDGGFKAFAADRGYGPAPVRLPGAAYRWGGDEFGYLQADPAPKLGEKIEFLPPHCDPTVNLYDRIYACRGEAVEEIWPVMSRFSAAKNASPED